MIGHDIEGPLHRPDSVLAFMAAAAGLRYRPLHGRAMRSGEPMLVHWGAGGAIPSRPHFRMEKDGDIIKVAAVGTEPQLRKIWADLRKKYGANVPSFDDIPREVRHEKSGPVQMALQMPFPDAERLAAKTALAAGALAWGDPFIDSAVARNLRSILRRTNESPLPTKERVDLKYVDVIVSTARTRLGLELPDVSIPSTETGRWVSQVVLGTISETATTTAVLCHILSTPTPGYGLLVEGLLPGRPVLPIVLREELGRPWILIHLEKIAFGHLDAD